MIELLHKWLIATAGYIQSYPSLEVKIGCDYKALLTNLVT